MLKSHKCHDLAPIYGAVALRVFLLSAPAFAEPTQAQISAIRAACQSDYRANCATVQPGGPAALACLKTNLANLSARCQKALNAASAAAAPTAPAPSGASPASAPAATTTPHPATAAPPPPPPAAATATPAPPKTFPPMSPREELRVIRFSCGRDFRALCGGVPPGQGRIAACLRANAASLSPACKAALMGARR